MKLSGLTLLLFTVSHCALFAQVTQRINIIISPSAEMRMLENTTQNTSFLFANGNDLENGLVRTNAASFEVRSNTDWMVSVKSGSPYFKDAHAGENTPLPSSILAVKSASNNSGFIPLSDSDVGITSGLRSSLSNANTFSVDYQARPGVEYKPGIYTMDVLFTVTGI